MLKYSWPERSSRGTVLAKARATGPSPMWLYVDELAAGRRPPGYPNAPRNMTWAMRLASFVVCVVFTAGCFGPTNPSDTSPIRQLPSPPSPPAIVSGVVTDSLHYDPVSGARIEWAGPTDAWKDRDGVLSDDNGAYSMSVDRPACWVDRFL